nr:hypothetical protein Iba_chr13cCG1070 [Ipomoea batatas]
MESQITQLPWALPDQHPISYLHVTLACWAPDLDSTINLTATIGVSNMAPDRHRLTASLEREREREREGERLPAQAKQNYDDEGFRGFVSASVHSADRCGMPLSLLNRAVERIWCTASFVLISVQGRLLAVAISVSEI